jgi:flagellar motility protein MotE (MotC chaperone)
MMLNPHRKPSIAGTVLLVALALAVPAGPTYSMSTIRSWVNKVRPGTFPELEVGAKQPPKPADGTRPTGEAFTDTERQILLSLMERKRQLDDRELTLNQREEQLRQLRDNVQNQVAELKRLQQEIEASMDAKKTQDAENLNKVVTLYNGMDPKKTAEKFRALEPKIAVQILMAMNQRKAAQLMEELPPEHAKRITEEIVRRAPASPAK